MFGPGEEPIRRMIHESPWAEVLSREEEANLAKCIHSIPPIMHFSSFIIGGALCAGTCYRFVPKSYLKYIGLAGGVVSAVMSRVATLQACIKEAAPSLLDPKNRDILKAKLANIRSTLKDDSLRWEEPAQEEPSTSTLSALEFDDPISSTQSFSDPPIATLEEAEAPQQKKPMTYEELRKKHRDEYQQEYRKRVVSGPRERVSEEPRTSEYPYKHRNKYGDDME